MPAPARKAAPRKAPAKKITASVAARREVRTQKATAPPTKVPFRGVTFEVSLDKLGVERVYMRQKAFEHFGTSDELVALLFDVLGARNSSQFIERLEPGDTLLEVAGEFFKALNKAGNDPNS